MRGVGLILGAMFAVFAAVEWAVASRIRWQLTGDLFDDIFTLFQLFWLLGWSVGVAILGVLTALFFFFSEAARLENGRLLVIPKLGPLKIHTSYDLSNVSNVRLEHAGDVANVRVRFDYGGASRTLGDTMPRPIAQRLADTLQSAGTQTSPWIDTWSRPSPAATLADSDANRGSVVALLAANMIPLAGVLLFKWDLADVMMLFWVESAIIAFYAALKMAVAGKLLAIVAVPFFIGHFGGFMALHFLFINLLFVHGGAAGILKGLWTAIAALVISHGFSFFDNFIGRREFERASMTDLMTAPYNRVMVMQLALIFGGWIVLLLHRPAGALIVLVVAKTALDLQAHRKERRRFVPHDARPL